MRKKLKYILYITIDLKEKILWKFVKKMIKRKSEMLYASSMHKDITVRFHCLQN